MDWTIHFMLTREECSKAKVLLTTSNKMNHQNIQTSHTRNHKTSLNISAASAKEIRSQ